MVPVDAASGTTSLLVVGTQFVAAVVGQPKHGKAQFFSREGQS